MQLLLAPFLALCCSAAARNARLALANGTEESRWTTAHQDPFSTDRRGLVWFPGQPLMQGFIGFSGFERVAVEDSGPVSIDGDDGELDELPLIGGGAQWKVGGRRIDLGLEGLLSFAGRADAEAFVIGGGGGAVAVDVDLLLFDLYGGPFASVFLGEKLRLYGAAGPLMQSRITINRAAVAITARASASAGTRARESSSCCLRGP